jgi:aminomethyltransferase
MVEFAGYEMPLHFALGIRREHLWTREHAGAFDVSHMGPAFLKLADRSGNPDTDHRAVAALVERVVCGDIVGLKPGQMRYTLMLNYEGGIVDDLIVGRPSRAEDQGNLYLVANAGRKEADFVQLAKSAKGAAVLARADGEALIALQGPASREVLGGLIAGIGELKFMTLMHAEFSGEDILVSRSGYTGEDGFEILIPESTAVFFWERLLDHPLVAGVGLGARDSLRLEAGLPLYGHDLDETVSPVEADLAFAVSKRRVRAADFPGATRVERELMAGPGRLLVGLRVLEGAPAREGAAITDEFGVSLGSVTSGGFSPSLGAPIAMGFVPPASAAPGTPVRVVVRGRAQKTEVAARPFLPHRYHR